MEIVSSIWFGNRYLESTLRNVAMFVWILIKEFRSKCDVIFLTYQTRAPKFGKLLKPHLFHPKIKKPFRNLFSFVFLWFYFANFAISINISHGLVYNSKTP